MKDSFFNNHWLIEVMVRLEKEKKESNCSWDEIFKKCLESLDKHHKYIGEILDKHHGRPSSFLKHES